jgi:hypothetical protein
MADDQIQNYFAHHHEFLPYFGNHHEETPPPDKTRGGGVEFGEHFGKPLTKRLWDDLTTCLMVRRILIYRPGDGEWTLGWGSGTCIIHLDDKDLVKGIEIIPYHPCRREHKEDTRPVTYGGGEIFGYTNSPSDRK